MREEKQAPAAPGADASTRERLIQAAIDSIYLHGYGSTTLAKIGELAESPPSAVSHYFDSKEDLLVFAMRRVLTGMHGSVIDRCGDAASPRAKLWAIIQSVLGEDTADERINRVWLAFLAQAEHDDKLRRVRDIYNRRLAVNVRAYLRQMYEEIGATDVRTRAGAGAEMLVGLMHGVWISHIMRDSLSADLSHGRLLVWECLEMLISRAREPLLPEEYTVATSANLLSDVSVELTAADLRKMDEWDEHAAAGSAIYLPHFSPGEEADAARARQAGRLLDSGYAPVPHIAARSVQDEAELERIVAAMTGVGARRFLLLGGGNKEPRGRYHCAMQLLQSGVFGRHNVEEVGFAGHPEEHPEQPRHVMQKALVEKIAFAKEAGLRCNIVTQFCFTRQPFFDFLDWARESKFNVPVRIGVAGRVDAAKLFKFAVSCGIGRSLLFLRRQFGKTKKLVNYSPEGLLAELAAGMAVRRYNFPVGVHFYPFGAAADTLALVSAAGLETGAADLSIPKEGEHSNVH